MTSSGIADKITRHIRAAGPVTVAAYMAMALHHPKAGYYARRRPIGADGDYITAPEISQIFGELIGLWCAALWDEMGRPDPLLLAELGPGRGVLMADLLRAAAAMPGFREAVRLYLVEASPALRAEQQQRVGSARPVWVTGVDELPDGPLLLVANEFLDALPVRQFVRGRQHWSERMVALDAADRLVFVDGAENPAASMLVPHALRRDAPPGTIAELCPAALALAASLGKRLTRQPGAALLVDYGYHPTLPGPTLRALHGHRPVPVLSMPGAADLSTHVDFAMFAETACAEGTKVWGPVAQRRFFAELGIGARLDGLCARATPSQRESLTTGVERLLDPGEMGDLFKVLAVTSPTLARPEGFAAYGATR